MIGRRFGLILLPAVVLAKASLLRFADYPAIGNYNGKNATVALRNTDTREFRTQLPSAARQRPNFAGHYILAAWGCGSECLGGAAIDANTGEVHWLPHTICCWPPEIDRPIQYHLDSRLIVFIGERNEKEGDVGTHYYEFRHDEFVHIKSIRNQPAPKQ